MRRNDAGKLDLAAVANLAASLAALVAVATAALVFRQVRADAERTRLSAGIESVWHLSDQWNSPSMLDIRSVAAGGLLAGKATAEMGDVLDFFEEVSRLLDRGAVDEELAALQFYWPMANYWSASREYVKALQRTQSAPWDEVGAVVTRLGAVAAQRKRRTAELLPSDEQVRQFLLDEQGEDECSDDTEARKTPL